MDGTMYWWEEKRMIVELGPIVFELGEEQRG